MTESYAAYCIIDSDHEMPDGIDGLHACAVSNLPHRGIGIVLSTLARPIQDRVAGAVEHEMVVERLMQTHTVLPMRFPTIFPSRDAVLAMMMQHHHEFRADLDRLHGQVEFGVRVLRPEVEESVPETQGWDMGSGTRYMQERYRRHRRRQVLCEQAAQFGHTFDAALCESATAKRLLNPTTASFVFDGVYLVRRDRETDFRQAFAEAKNREPDFRYLLSGPWPPYNFISTNAGTDCCRVDA